jgi:hypothetical protein
MILVMRSQRVGRFIVLEGSRRILAVKLVKKPSASRRPQHAGRAQKNDCKEPLRLSVSEAFDSVNCYIVADRAEAVEWSRQRHTGRR